MFIMISSENPDVRSFGQKKIDVCLMS